MACMRTLKCGVYKVQSPCRGVYIGSTYDLDKRTREHKTMLRAGRHHSKLLQEASDRFGMSALTFELILECPVHELFDREQDVIDCLDPIFNRSKRSREALSTLWKDPEFRERNTNRAKELAAKQVADPAFIERCRSTVSRMHTPEAISKATAARRKRWAEDPEFAERMRKKSGDVFREKFADPEYRDKHAARQSALMKERLVGSDHMKRMNEVAMQSVRKPVQCVETGEIFPSVKAAGEWSKIPSYQNIGSAASGRIKSCGGYHWKWPDGN